MLAQTDKLRFCLKILQKQDAVKCFRRIDFQTVYHFLNWYLGQRTGKGGRLKRPVRSKGSLITLWCCFRLGYERAINQKIDLKIDRDLMKNVSAQPLSSTMLWLMIDGRL